MSSFSRKKKKPFKIPSSMENDINHERDVLKAWSANVETLLKKLEKTIKEYRDKLDLTIKGKLDNHLVDLVPKSVRIEEQKRDQRRLATKCVRAIKMYRFAKDYERLYEDLDEALEHLEYFLHLARSTDVIGKSLDNLQNLGIDFEISLEEISDQISEFIAEMKETYDELKRPPPFDTIDFGGEEEEYLEDRIRVVKGSK